MIAHNHNSLCRQTELYYYDFLCGESRGVVPESMVDHIEQCRHCQEQLIKLKAVLSQAESSESQQRQVSSVVTTMLKLHFAYIGKPVTCNIVKPFLPTLLDPALGMRIPTPIVTHLHNCKQCSEDLDIIRCLNLSRKQLCRLSQLLADRTPENNISCSKAQNAIQTLASIVFGKTDSEVLKHLCLCPGCRKLLYQRREMVLRGLSQTKRAQHKFLCEEVSATDIFDYVMPYGIDPASDQYAKFRKSLTSHAVTCPNCLAKMQTLHNTVYSIAERPESEVVTIYHIDESAKAESVSESDELYAGFPIRVEIAHRSEDEVDAGRPVSIINSGAIAKRKASTTNLGRLARTVTAAAAVILIATALLLNIPTARAVTIGQIYKAVEKVGNVYISRFVPDETGSIQEKWVSRTLNIFMIKTGKQLVLWDLNEAKKTKRLDTVVTETISLTAVSVADIEKKITGSLGLTPFYDISGVPQDAQWSRITGEGLKIADKGVEVYDLTWVEEKYGGAMVFSKWRVFVDAVTNLPQKVEWYRKLPADSEYALEMEQAVKYLSDSEMRAVIADSSF